MSDATNATPSAEPAPAFVRVELLDGSGTIIGEQVALVSERSRVLPGIVLVAATIPGQRSDLSACRVADPLATLARASYATDGLGPG